MLLFLPSIRSLKSTLSKIPFNTGIIKPVLDNLKKQTKDWGPLDKTVVLAFDGISLSKGFYYETKKQEMCGFEDLGNGRRRKVKANHAEVYMIRGVKRSFKQVVAYYFSQDALKTVELKHIIVEVIESLQSIGLSVEATVCDQGPTNVSAIRELCQENKVKPTNYHFVVNGHTICTLFDVPHLLKNTRNAMLTCNIS